MNEENIWQLVLHSVKIHLRVPNKMYPISMTFIHSICLRAFEEWFRTRKKRVFRKKNWLLENWKFLNKFGAWQKQTNPPYCSYCLHWCSVFTQKTDFSTDKKNSLLFTIQIRTLRNQRQFESEICFFTIHNGNMAPSLFALCFESIILPYQTQKHTMDNK